MSVSITAEPPNNRERPVSGAHPHKFRCRVAQDQVWTSSKPRRSCAVGCLPAPAVGGHA